MYYYNIWVRSNKYKSSSPLTYSHERQLKTGQIVEIKLQNNKVLGFISSRVLKPRFPTKTIDFVYDIPPVNKNGINLMNWIKQYYPSDIGVITQLLLPRSLPQKLSTSNHTDKTTNKFKAELLPKLTNEQKAALDAMQKVDTYLIHGVTGSGKTRIYVEMIKKTIKEGKSAIILTPEISLTSQLYSNLSSQFGPRVNILHSKQTILERRNVWLKCLNANEPLILIGPRSALFAPIEKVGLIVVDEAHESAYKQDQMPHYNSIRVASYLAKIQNAYLIIGSATPLVNDYYLATSKNKTILEMKNLAKSQQATSQELRVAEIIDLKKKDNFNSSSLLSDQLIQSIKKSLDSNEQSLLYLNRRGTAKMIMCENCGWEMLCKFCNLPMTYHKDKHKIICHSCGKIESEVPFNCPSCNSASVMYKTPGTKAVVEEVKKIFPGAIIKRFDTDNSKDETFEKNYEEIIRGKVDIIIGTQLLAKGLDLPKLSTLGVLQADTSLYIPDYLSEERIFQLISQVLGRINRGHVKGRAIIQTYNPDSEIIKMAIKQDYRSFYEKELLIRKKYRLPPFYSLLKLSVQRKSSSSSQKSAQKLKESIEITNNKLIIDGPLPAFYEQHGKYFEWHLVVKSTSRNELLSVIGMLPSGWKYDIDPYVLL